MIGHAVVKSCETRESNIECNLSAEEKQDATGDAEFSLGRENCFYKRSIIDYMSVPRHTLVHLSLPRCIMLPVHFSRSIAQLDRARARAITNMFSFGHLVP
jgi:hypothetical protein